MHSATAAAGVCCAADSLPSPAAESPCPTGPGGDRSATATSIIGIGPSDRRLQPDTTISS